MRILTKQRNLYIFFTTITFVMTFFLLRSIQPTTTVIILPEYFHKNLTLHHDNDFDKVIEKWIESRHEMVIKISNK